MAGKKAKKRLEAGLLRKIGVKEVLIPGILLAAVLGWTGWKKLGPDIYTNKQIFPDSGVVRTVTDGDTLELNSGVRVRLIGVNSPDRGQEKFQEATKKMQELVLGKKVWLEYDRYQDDKTGRVLAWIWVGCDPSAGSGPKFLPADYMHLTYNRSREGLNSNPEGCKDGTLAQEEMIKSDLAEVEVYKDRGELKYEGRLLGTYAKMRGL